ncbi:MAG: T9SS type A sorting domain-containing protein [Bacteroidetes bacterium]|nr:T9SS type A sorting domain-containing protein [Bacteroidota bacterium]
MTCFISRGQNLVPNGSFEEMNWCPNYIDDIFSLQGWTSFAGTPDVYNACNTDTIKGVPINFAGSQEPASGNSYAGLMSYDATIPWHEYYAIRLITTLLSGVKYYASIKVSLAECSSYATNNMGIGFSTDSFQTTFVFTQDSLFHYVKINSVGIVSEATNWVTISGSFIADSAYKYIIVGNFYGYNSTDTLFRNNTCLYDIGYYYLDDVCVSTDSFTCNVPVGIQEPKQNEQVSIYPNPFSNQLSLVVPNNEETTLRVYDMLGQQVLQNTFINSTTLNTASLARGIYFYELRNEKNVMKKGKLIKE